VDIEVNHFSCTYLSKACCGLALQHWDHDLCLKLNLSESIWILFRRFVVFGGQPSIRLPTATAFTPTSVSSKLGSLGTAINGSGVQTYLDLRCKCSKLLGLLGRFHTEHVLSFRSDVEPMYFHLIGVLFMHVHALFVESFIPKGAVMRFGTSAARV
jgi:hypothetical protein